MREFEARESRVSYWGRILIHIEICRFAVNISADSYVTSSEKKRIAGSRWTSQYRDFRRILVSSTVKEEKRTRGRRKIKSLYTGKLCRAITFWK